MHAPQSRIVALVGTSVHLAAGTAGRAQTPGYQVTVGQLTVSRATGWDALSSTDFQVQVRRQDPVVAARVTALNDRMSELVDEAQGSPIEDPAGTAARVPSARVGEVITFLREQADVVAPVESAPWPDADPDDRWIVAAALVGSADVLVTGDRDPLDVGRAAGLRVVTPMALWKLLRTPRPG